MVTKLQRIMMNKKMTRKDWAMDSLMRPFDYNPVIVDVMPRKGMKLENNNELTIFFLTIGAESRSQPPEGQKAVAEVILNRVFQQKTYFGMNIREVCLKSDRGVFQFSCWRPTDPNRRWMTSPDPTELLTIVKNTFPIYFGMGRIMINRQICYYKSINLGNSGFWTNLHHERRIHGHDFYLDPNLKT